MHSIRNLSKNKFVWDRVAAISIEWKSASPQKFLEVDAIQDAQRDDLLDVSRRVRQRFVVGQRAWRRKIEFIGKCACNLPT